MKHIALTLVSAAVLALPVGAVHAQQSGAKKPAATKKAPAKKPARKAPAKTVKAVEGTVTFELDDLDIGGKTDLYDLGWEMSKGLSTEYLLMEGARVQDESGQSFVPTEEFGAEEGGEESGWEDDWGAPPPERKDISALKSLTHELRFPDSASEITLLILRFASDIFDRGVLFMVGREEIVGLGQFGLDIEGADEKVRETVLVTENSPFLRKIILEQMPFRGAVEKDAVTDRMMEELGGLRPAEAVLLLTGYRADPEFMRRIGVEINPETQAPRYHVDTYETNVPGLFVAGGQVAGMRTGTVFIENGRFHGSLIAKTLADRAGAL